MILQSATFMVGIKVGVGTSHQLICFTSFPIADILAIIRRRLSVNRSFRKGFIISPFSIKNNPNTSISINTESVLRYYQKADDYVDTYIEIPPQGFDKLEEIVFGFEGKRYAVHPIHIKFLGIGIVMFKIKEEK